MTGGGLASPPPRAQYSVGTVRDSEERAACALGGAIDPGCADMDAHRHALHDLLRGNKGRRNYAAGPRVCV